MPKIRSKDISIYYETRGSGEPLLLISGLGADNSSWLGVVRELSEHFMTIVIDNRGSGRSDVPDNKYTISDMAEDVVNLLDHLKIEKAHVIGHSMGGYIAQEYAITYPARVNKLILESTAPVSTEKNNMLFKDMYEQLKREKDPEPLLRRWTKLLFAPGLLTDNSFAEMFIRNSVRYPYLQKEDGFKGQIEAIMSFDARERVSSIKTKTLVLAGKDDILITPQESETLVKNIQGSVFTVLDGVAHCTHIEDPKLFISTVIDFLKRDGVISYLGGHGE